MLVVDDSSTDESPAVGAEFGVSVLHTGKRSSPAFARNLGASKAEGRILFFIDADVCVYPYTVARAHANLHQDPELAAVIGSYDDLPEAQDFRVPQPDALLRAPSGAARRPAGYSGRSGAAACASVAHRGCSSRAQPGDGGGPRK